MWTETTLSFSTYYRFCGWLNLNFICSFETTKHFTNGLLLICWNIPFVEYTTSTEHLLLYTKTINIEININHDYTIFCWVKPILLLCSFSVYNFTFSVHFLYNLFELFALVLEKTRLNDNWTTRLCFKKGHSCPL